MTYRVTFHVAAMTMSGHATYDINATDEHDAIAEARRRAHREHIPTVGATVEVEEVRP